MVVEAEITEPLTVFWESTINFLPNLFASVVLLVIGWIIGTVIGRITKELMLRFKVDQYVAKKRPMVRLSDVFPIIFEWAIYLVFIQAAVQSLGVVALVDFVGMLIGFIPGLVGAIIVVIVGYAIAEYAKSQLEKGELPYSDIMAKILFWLVIYVSIALALPLVGIDPTLINNILLVIVGSFGAGMAIAIGLGLKDTIATLAEGYSKELKKKRKKKKKK